MSSPDDPNPHEDDDANWEFYDSEFDDEWEAYAQKLREQAEQRRRLREEEAKQAESSEPDEAQSPRPIPAHLLRELVSSTDEPVDGPPDLPTEPPDQEATSTRSAYEANQRDSASCCLMWLLAFGALFLFIFLGLIVFATVRYFGTSEDVVVVEPKKPQPKTKTEDPETDVSKPRVAEELPVEITNSIGMKLRRIPSGEFLMGSPDLDDTAYVWEKPQHKVRITEPFYIGVYEVTQAQWDRVLGQRTWDPWMGVGADYPASHISWDDAMEFCRKLTDQEQRAGHLPAGCEYKLPTEAQWEYACRAGTTTRYCFGDDPSRLAEYAWFTENAADVGERAHQVGSKKPNAWGLYDMHGHVSEWCADWFDRYGSAFAADPVGPPDGDRRVLRGGSCQHRALETRSAIRQNCLPDDGWSMLGFRVVRTCGGVEGGGEGDTAISAVNETGRQRTGKAPLLTMAPFDSIEAKEHQQAWAEFLGVPVETANSIGMQLIVIPPGEFLMGGQDIDVDKLYKAATQHLPDLDRKTVSDFVASLGPRHRVVLTKPFYLGLHEVTVGQYRKFVDETGYVTESEKKREGTWRNPGYSQSDDHPVVYVRWHDAKAFTDWLSRKEARTYRLPTEAECEYACRAGTTTRYYFGDQDTNLSEFEWWGGNSGGVPHPVGAKHPNPWGLYDTLGNVREWCADWHSRTYYQRSPLKDPTGPGPPEPGSGHVMRLGAWQDDLTARLWCCMREPGALGKATRGFRVVCEIPAKLALPLETTGDSVPPAPP